jgi:hypothetical protein
MNTRCRFWDAISCRSAFGPDAIGSLAPHVGRIRSFLKAELAGHHAGSRGRAKRRHPAPNEANAATL